MGVRRVGGGDVKWFPDNKQMPPSGVQAGTIYNRSIDHSRSQGRMIVDLHPAKFPKAR
ncbi:hypothetical protein ES332_A05G029100v1 [Gossypium tomentosum]|uniref:Uncharacterized protein n=1 Tax=Gossypium tomentosum TaxID=34277 RepID=A0A5D2Q9U3_GOSTO|nr:hypothetical protein ES332_A05G029100v1 [Gossypium tomentosum]